MVEDLPDVFSCQLLDRRYHWICEQCFQHFWERFCWRVLNDSQHDDQQIAAANAGWPIQFRFAGRCALVGSAWLSFGDRKSTRLNSSHGYISYAVFCLTKK